MPRSPATKEATRPRRATSRRRTAPDCAFDPKLNIKLKGSTETSRPSGIHAASSKPPRVKPTSRRSPWRCRRASSSTTPTSAPSAPGSSSPANACPAGSVYRDGDSGDAAARPAADGQCRTCGRPRHKLPDLVADLRGQIRHRGLGQDRQRQRRGPAARFETVPDAPVSEFVLEMAGGKKGLLVNSGNLCKADRRAKLELVGQNGAKVDRKSKLQSSCGSKSSRAHKRGQKKAGH